jgi:DNA-binding XRE family transcriptional regulator
MGKRHPHISDTTIDDSIAELDARRPGFKARVEARVQQLAIARQVRKLREKRNLTQTELAELAGTGQAAIARIESGRTVPKLDLLARIADALNATMKLSLAPRRA